MHSRITNVIFDLDGTLVDSAPSILACFTATLAAHGIEPLIPMSDALIGPPLRETLQKLSNIEDPNRLELMIEEFKQHYDTKGYKATKVFPGVDSMLNDLHVAGFRLHIATNKRLKPALLILDHLGWSKLFKSVFASDSQTPSFTSKSAMLEALIVSESIYRSQAVYIGDKSDDRRAAFNNGLEFIGASWGYCDTDMLGSLSVRHAIQLNKILIESFCL